MRKPNILLITADQLRYDCIGPSGLYPVRTPALDRLAAEGVTFSEAYSHIPVCCPARQSLLSGSRAETFGALWNFGGALPVRSLETDRYTWTKALQANGYATAFLGKWGVHPKLDATAFGYDSYVGEDEYGRFVKANYASVRFTNGYFGETNPIPLADAKTHWLADKASATMRQLNGTGKPWHMAVHFSEPHLPCQPSEPFASMYGAADIPEWAGFRETFASKPYIQRQQLYNWGIEQFTWEDWAPVVARYYSVISQLDDAVGRILQTLGQIGAADNTIVIFTADHGDMCGSHRMMDKHYILYDDVVHVPLIVRWPGGMGGAETGGSVRGDGIDHTLSQSAADSSVAVGVTGVAGSKISAGLSGAASGAGAADQSGGAGVTEAAWRNEAASLFRGGGIGAGTGGAACSSPVYNLLDFAPTVLEWAGLPMPEGMKLHGRSLVPLLRGETPGDWRDCIVASYNGQQFGLYTQRMIRTGRWKYVWNTTDIDELYDLHGDPAELANRIADPECGELVADLRRRLYDVLERDGDALVGNEWMRRQLLQPGAKLGPSELTMR